MGEPARRSDVRSAGRAARQALAGAERGAAEAKLIEHLLSLRAIEATSVGIFIAHDGEPDLQPLIDHLWAAGRTVALPVLDDDPSDFSMRFVPWRAGDELKAGRYDIPVPPDTAPLVPSSLLVSLTGFDSSGNRIGRGGGFFDRYLASYTGNVIGVGFEAQRFDAIPIEPHDQPLRSMVTDLGVRFFPRR